VAAACSTPSTAPGVRLLGVAVSGLAQAVGEQLSLGDAHDHSGWTTATRAVDDVRERFGATAIGPASLVGRDGLKLTRRGRQQWGPDQDDDGSRTR
jgi:DNA polymerase-4